MAVLRRIGPSVIALAVLGALVQLFRVAQRFDPAAPAASGYRDAGLGDVSIRMSDARIVHRVGGKPMWTLRAGRIDLKHTPGGDLEALRQAEFSKITDGVLYRDGKPDARFEANHAVYDHAAQRFDIRGGIRIRTPKGGRIMAEELVWSERDEFVRFPVGARAEFDKDRVSAPMLLYAPKRRIVQCPQGAEGLFDGHPLRATELHWDVDRGRVDLPGMVSGERRNLTFTAARAVLDLKAKHLSANEGALRFRIEGEGFEPEDLR